MGHLWSNARMDKRTIALTATAVQAMRRDAPIHEPYMVRWFCDDFGWRTTYVMATSAEAAVDHLIELVGLQAHMEAFKTRLQS